MWRRLVPRFLARPPTGLPPAARLRAAARRLFSTGSGAGGAEGEPASEPRVTLHLRKLKIPGGRDYEEVNEAKHTLLRAVRLCSSAPADPLPLVHCLSVLCSAADSSIASLVDLECQWHALSRIQVGSHAGNRNEAQARHRRSRR